MDTGDDCDCCPYDDKSKNGKFCKFLKDPQCERFEKRATNGIKVE